MSSFCEIVHFTAGVQCWQLLLFRLASVNETFTAIFSYILGQYSEHSSATISSKNYILT